MQTEREYRSRLVKWPPSVTFSPDFAKVANPRKLSWEVDITGKLVLPPFQDTLLAHAREDYEEVSARTKEKEEVPRAPEIDTRNPIPEV